MRDNWEETLLAIIVLLLTLAGLFYGGVLIFKGQYFEGLVLLLLASIFLQQSPFH